MRTRRRWWGGLAWLAGGACGLAAMALGADLVRLYWAHTEIRNSVAAAALAAASELDGTPEGLLRARRAAHQAWRRSVIAAAVASVAEADFAASPAGPWDSRPEALARCGFVRVRAAGVVRLSVLSLLRPALSRAVRAEAIAGHLLGNQGYENANHDGAGAAGLVTLSLGVARSPAAE